MRLWAAVFFAALTAATAYAQNGFVGGIGASNGNIGGYAGGGIGGGTISSKVGAVTPPTPSLTISGPSSGVDGVASTNFTITLFSALFNGSTNTVTIADGSNSGSFTPSVGSCTAGTGTCTVTPTASSNSFTFTYTPANTGYPLSLTVTNSFSAVNPSAASYTSNPSGYTVAGPTSGATGSPSTNFTATLTPSGAKFSGSQTITLHDGSAGNTFTPSVGSPGIDPKTVTQVAGQTNFTFTYTASANGTYPISTTNAQGWTPPATINYTASTIVACTNQLVTDYSNSCALIAQAWGQ